MKDLMKVLKHLLTPRDDLMQLLHTPLGRLLSDKTYISAEYYVALGKKMNWDSPDTYNEKINWLKLYDHNDSYSDIVDKYKFKKYISERIGEEYVIPLLGVWKNPDDIDFDKLPDMFVLKPNHTSGDVIICKDKKSLDYKKTRKQLKKWLKRNYYLNHREYPYKDIERRIIAEQYIVDESGYELKDWKFFCFNGEPKFLFVATDRGIDTRFDFFDLDFNHIDVLNGHENALQKIKRPRNFEKMVELARELSKGFTHVRVDFYNVNGKLYVGEMTFYHWSGLVKFQPEEYDKVFGRFIDLSKEKGAQTNH